MVKLSGVEINPDEITDGEWEELLKAREESHGTWRPKYGDKYWYVSIYYSGISSYLWTGDDGDCMALEHGLAFPSEEAAEKHLAYLKALQVLKDDTKGFEWNKSDDYYVGWYEMDEDRLGWDLFSSIASPGVRFKSEEDIETSFETHRKEWLIVLGVE